MQRGDQRVPRGNHAVPRGAVPRSSEIILAYTFTIMPVPFRPPGAPFSPKNDLPNKSSRPHLKHRTNDSYRPKSGSVARDGRYMRVGIKHNHMPTICGVAPFEFEGIPVYQYTSIPV